MANTPQARKRIRRNDRRAVINGNRLSRIRTFVKKVEAALDAGDKTAAAEALKAPSRNSLAAWLAACCTRTPHPGSSRDSRSGSPRSDSHALIRCFPKKRRGRKKNMAGDRLPGLFRFPMTRCTSRNKKCLNHRDSR